MRGPEVLESLQERCYSKLAVEAEGYLVCLELVAVAVAVAPVAADAGIVGLDKQKRTVEHMVEKHMSLVG